MEIFCECRGFNFEEKVSLGNFLQLYICNNNNNRNYRSLLSEGISVNLNPLDNVFQDRTLQLPFPTRLGLGTNEIFNSLIF